MATIDEDILLARAQLAIDAMAISRAMLDRDFDEARFRAHLVLCEASTMGLPAVGASAQKILDVLGPLGTAPAPGIGRALLELSGAIDAVERA
jgi:hypothetical protein